MSWQGQVNQPIGVAGIDSNGKIHTLDASQVYNINASNIATGNLAVARLPNGGVNGASQLVQLDSSGNLPALDAASLTNLSAANITGSIPTSNLPKATTSAFGVVEIGSNIDVAAGVISVPAATTIALGVVQPDGVTTTIAGAKLVALGIPNYQTSATYDIGNQIRGDGTNGLVGAIYTCINNGSTGAFDIADWAIFGYAGTSNTVLGQSGFPLSATGTNNVAVGVGGLAALTTGTDNIALGKDALAAATTAGFNVAIGTEALQSFTGVGGLVAIGYQALKATTTGGQNTAVGYQALTVNTTGAGNTAVGTAALNASVVGNSNTALGYSAMLRLTSGDGNTAVGQNSLSAATTGVYNTVLGLDAGANITIGQYNTIIGSYGGVAGMNNTVVLSDGQANLVLSVPTGGAALPANKFLATPNGATGPASPRSIVAADLPSIPNSLTTATSTDIASAIVARDINGDFSAGTITADLTGTASGNQTLQSSAVNGDFAVWNAAGQTVDSGLSLNTSTTLVGAANTNIPSTLAIKTYVDNAVTGGLNIIGTWDASTNTPTLTAGVGVRGNAYICNVAGTQTLPSGSPVAYSVGDVLFYSAGSIWDVIPAGNTVVSVNGQQGIVSLGLADMDDTTITGPAATQLLVYNGTVGKWENVDLTGVIAITEAGVSSFANTITIAQGGTSATTQQAAINNLAGAVTSGAYLRGDGTNVSMSAIQAADVPTLNQNTTGNAATATTATNLSGTSVNAIPYQSASATTGYISTANDAVLVTNGSGSPSFATTLPAVDGSALTSLNASNISSGTVPIANLPVGTALAKGILQVGTNISVSSGTISVATAGATSGSAGTLGLVAGDGVTIEVDGSGIASAVAATNTTAGIVTPDNSTLKVVASKLTATTATTSQLGVVKPDGVTITVTGGVISASASALPITTTAIDYTVLGSDGIVLVTAPNVVVTLPLVADGVVGKVYTIKAGNVAGCTVVPQTGELLDGITSAGSYALDNYFSLNTFTDGTQWYIYG